MSPIPWDELFSAAEAARKNAWAPYSKFQVGASGLFDDGTIVSGCNVENASYGLSMCAERNAIARAVVAGHKKLSAIAIVVDAERAVPPCGACRQVIAEFAAKDVPVRTRTPSGKEAQYTLGDLLPHAFTRDFL